MFHVLRDIETENANQIEKQAARATHRKFKLSPHYKLEWPKSYTRHAPGKVRRERKGSACSCHSQELAKPFQAHTAEKPKAPNTLAVTKKSSTNKAAPGIRGDEGWWEKHPPWQGVPESQFQQKLHPALRCLGVENRRRVVGGE